LASVFGYSNVDSISRVIKKHGLATLAITESFQTGRIEARQALGKAGSQIAIVSKPVEGVVSTLKKASCERIAPSTQRVFLGGLDTDLFDAQEMLKAVVFLMNNGDDDDCN
jgi:hypothetical protein